MCDRMSRITKIMLTHPMLYKALCMIKLDKFYWQACLGNEILKTGANWSDADIEIKWLGFKMNLVKNSAIDYAFYMLKKANDIYEPDTINYLKDKLKSGDAFIDGGAASGYFSLYASKLVGPHGKVFAFEPTNFGFKRLKCNIAINNFKNIVAYKKALSDANETAEISLSENDGGNSLAVATSEHKERVEVTTLDTVFSKGLPNLKCIKLDIEGMEAEAIAGARNLLLRSKSDVLFEFNYELLTKKNGNYNEAFDALRKLGYDRFVQIDDNNRRIESYKDSNKFVMMVLASMSGKSRTGKSRKNP